MRIYILIFFFCSFIKTYSQVNEKQLGGWYSLRLTTALGNDWEFNTEIHDRNWNIIGDLQQFVMGFGFRKKVASKGIALTMFNSYFLSKKPFPESNFIPEYRVHQKS